MRSISNTMLVILILFVALLSGCELLQAPTPADQSPHPTPTMTPEPSPTPSPTATPVRGLITLNLWAPDFLDPYVDRSESEGLEENEDEDENREEIGAPILNDQLTTFNHRHQDMQVQVTVKKATGPGGLYHLLSTAADAAPAVLPDLIILNPTDLRAAIQDGSVQPLPITLPEGDYFPFTLTGQTKITRSYGFPYVVQADHMVYRPGATATPPLSWTSVLTHNYTILWPAAPPDKLADDALLAAYLSTGGAVVDENGDPTLERENLEALYDFFFQLMARDQIDPERLLDLSDATACWEAYQERAAQISAAQISAAPAGPYWANPPINDQPSWVPTPDGDPTGIAHVWTIALVTTNPARQAAAMTLAQWLTAPEQVAILTRSIEMLPPRSDAVQLWGLLPEETAFLEEFLSAASPPLRTSVDEPVRRALQAGLRALLAGEVETPTAAATHALGNLRK